MIEAMLTRIPLAFALLLLVALINLFLPLRASADPSGPFRWDETTQVANAGWGRMIPLTDGRWLCVSTLYPTPNSILQIEISADGARTWTPLATVAEPGRNLDNGEFIALPSGELLLTGRSLVETKTPGGRLSFHLPVYRSRDRGKTWTFISQIDTSEPPPFQAGRPSLGLWEPHFFFLTDGRLACAYADETRAADPVPYSQIVSERVSSDGGARWGPKIVLTAQIGGGNQRPGMPVVTRMKNGQYIAVYEVVEVGNADVYFKTSRDGMEWPPGLGVRIPCQHAGPWVTSLSDGRLVVTSCSNQLSYSDDYGAAWQLATPPPWPLGQVYSWPAIYQTGPETLAVMTTRHGIGLRWGRILPKQKEPTNFVSDFTHRSGAGWTQYGGHYQFADGVYLAENAGTTGKSLTGDPNWKDGVLEADVRLTSAGNAGLVFRTTNADINGPDSIFGYYAGFDSSGSLFLSRSVNDYTELARAPMEVPLNTWQHLKVTLRGATLAVFVNGGKKPALQVSDSFFLRGQVGVRAHNCNAEFKNVRFESAAGKK